jgi:LuxR family transcriptional regulator, maltose regulon positive regulatory protein
VSLVVLEAPTGYGKTTLLEQWSASTAAGVRWARGGTTGGDLARLTAGVPGGRPVKLVVDDLHRRGHGVGPLAAFASRLAEGSQIVVATDRPVRWRLGGLVAAGRYAEFGRDDLAFDTSETGALLAAAGLQLDQEAVSELVRRTGGWVTGLRLALPALQASADPSVRVWTLDGEDAAFADYFRRRVLAGLSAPTVRFLLRSSVLERVSAPLCEAALQIPRGEACLAEVRALGLHLAPEDGSADWYRYHPLFAQMLRAELRRREPGVDLRIHRRAARWYEDDGQPGTAIEHALAGGAGVTAGRLIVAHAQELNSQGRITEARYWLDRIDDDVVAGYPPLGPMAAWVWALTGDSRRARRALGLAEASSFDGPLPDGSASLESAVVRARAALAPHGVQAMLADAERGVALEPPGSRWQSQASLLLGVALWVTGATEDAVRWLESAQRFGTENQRPGAVSALGQLAWLAAQRGDWGMAESCAGQSTDLIRAAGLQEDISALLTYLVNARVALQREEPDRAVAWLRSARRLYVSRSPAAFPWLAVQVAVTLGHVQLDLGDEQGARVRLAEARGHVRPLRPAGVLGGLVEGLARAVALAEHRTGAEERAHLTAAEVRVLRLLASHLSLAQIADELVVTRNTVKGHAAAVYRKLGAANRADAVRLGHEQGLLEPRPVHEFGTEADRDV